MHNKCIRCQSTADEIGEYKANPVFTCVNRYCGLNFVETGIGPEWLPGEFLVEETYVHRVDNHKDIYVKVLDKHSSSVITELNGSSYKTFDLSVIQNSLGTVEVLRYDHNWLGMVGWILPYGIVMDGVENVV